MLQISIILIHKINLLLNLKSIKAKTIKPNFIPLDSENIETVLESHAKTLYPHEAKKKYKITRISDHPKFIFKIDYDLLLDYGDEMHKSVAFFYKKGKKLRYYSYLMKVDLFDEFYEEAMFIIDSIEDRF
ncbi:hypothetical protein [Winogradskyella immobilis]|uniref:Uncharacterized protein n=1 Tax=Winogradskyella immobilis TaxID=2816852 RepID=A0ABS8EJT7_9FLAO|nr:hypothetical protein [Winogradskyella immobilis]MCC1483418.1 hypothetical protein [Winogradskyella immobilis]MCG0015512.1 hypothetical protein [Winogradskyella immobilis]